MSAALRAAAASDVRVIVCDDSAVIRGAITRMLESDASIRVIARASNGQIALDALRREPADVVVLDIEMPVMDGLSALPQLLKVDPGLRVIVASTLTTRGADIALQALRLGAMDYVTKPSVQTLDRLAGFRQELLAKVLGLGRSRRSPAPMPKMETFRLRPPPRLPPRLLAIASSTGGPQALMALFEGLGAPVPVPVVVTQHMPVTFTAMLAAHIERVGVMPCAEAKHGEKLRAGRIYVAPGSQHLLVRNEGESLVAQLSDGPPENFCRPSADPMLRSAAEACNGRVLVATLTGMGQDGLAGARLVVEAGGAAIAQDEATSVVWGMPGAIARAGLCHAVLPLSQIAGKLAAMLRAGAA